MSKTFTVEGQEVNVNDVFFAMDDGNRQHMANKLFKHGWVPVKMREYVNEPVWDDLLVDLEGRRELNPDPNELEVGQVLIAHLRSRGGKEEPYMVTNATCEDGTKMLINTRTGRRWSAHSTFGQYPTIVWKYA